MASKRPNAATDEPRERLRTDDRPLCRKENHFHFRCEREGTNELVKTKVKGEGRGRTGKKRRRAIRDADCANHFLFDPTTFTLLLPPF